MGVGHYENFPVASLLLPGPLRRPVAAIYRFARTADDIADEGDYPAAWRLQQLARLGGELDRIEAGQPVDDPMCVELAATIRQHRLPLEPFRDLLAAFSQDCVQVRYANFAELLDYARHSADPIGRLLLQLFGAYSTSTVRCSDRICSALQLINFWQDVAIDYGKGRIYLPLEDMQRFGVGEEELGRSEPSERFRRLLRFQIERTRRMLHEGAALGRLLKGRVGLEIRMVVAGGDTILHKIAAAEYDVFRCRPVLRARDWVAMLRRSLAGDGRIAA
jgi:squalene synthase HpnC